MEEFSTNTKQNQTVIFLHIPKAAGSTLNTIIERQYRSNTIFTIKDLRISINKLKKLPESKKEKFKVLRGHMGFGLDTFLPQPSTYVTLLRDPVERIISHYYFVLRSPKHYLYKTVRTSGMSLKDYASVGVSLELDNGQMRLIAGNRGEENQGIGFGHCTIEMLERAKRNLRDRFAVVGLAEEFDKTLTLLKQAFRWDNTFYTKQNVTESRPSKRDISTEVLQTIQKHNEFDVELYEYAKNLFQEQFNQSFDL